MNSLKFFNFRDWHPIPVQGFLQAPNRALWLFMVLNDVALKSVNCPPIDPQAIFMTASEVHLNFRTCGIFGSSTGSIRSPNPSVQCINSFTFVVTVVECFRLGVRVRRGRCAFSGGRCRAWSRHTSRWIRWRVVKGVVQPLQRRL